MLRVAGGMNHNSITHSIQPTGSPATGIYGSILLLVLIACGLAGNYFRFPIFLNIDFLFGSIFAMLALQFFGLGRGILAAAIIASYTWVTWNHPTGIISMTAEVAIVGWLMGRRKIGMVLADTVYWLLVGMPLLYLLTAVFQQAPTSTAYIIMIKQTVNGIANALIARLIYLGFAHRLRSSLASYREIVYNLLVFFVVCPTLIMLAVSCRTDFIETERHIRTTLIQNSVRVSLNLENWVANRKSTVVNLAELAASHSPLQMQTYLEQAKRSDLNFLRVGLADKNATSVAFSPLVDERGISARGVSFADRSYVPILRQTLKPMLSEAITGRIGTPRPIVLMLAPVVIQGEFGGYAIGVMSLEQIWEQLVKSTDESGSLYTLLDKNGMVIMTNCPDQTVHKPFKRGKGEIRRLDKAISLWVPTVPPNTPYFERWKKSFYVAESSIGSLSEWKLILEQPVAPFQKSLYAIYTGRLTLLFLILLCSLALAEFLSRRSIVTLEKLRTLTHELPHRLAKDDKAIAWPESGITETFHLIKNFRDMAHSLSELFNEVRHNNETLEQRVEERTGELRESEQRWKFAVEGSGDGVWDWNIATDEAKYSRRWKEMLGYDEPDILPTNQEWIDRIHPDDSSYVAGAMRDYLQGTTPIYVVEYRLRCKGGDYKWILGRGMVVHRSDDGSPLRMIGTHTDITERKRSEEALRESKEKYRAMIDAFDGLMYICSRDCRIEFMNENLIKRTGRNATGELCYRALHNLDSACEWCVNEQVFDGNTVHWETNSPKDNRWYEVTNSPVFNTNGTISKQAIIRDITARKLADEALKKSEAHYHLLVETSQDLIWQADTEGKFTFLNLAVEQVFGYELSEMLGRKFSDFQTPEQAARASAEFARLMQGESIDHIESIFIGKFGKEIHLVVNALFLSDDKGEIIGASGTAFDITSRKQMEDELRLAKAAAEANSIAKSQFLANMSHELRTPLNSVIGFTDVVLSKSFGPLNEIQDEYLGYVLQSSRHLLDLINDILDLSKVEADKMEIRPCNILIRDLLSNSLIMVRELADLRGVELREEFSADLPFTIRADERKFKQIIFNLLSNAIKFTHAGGTVTVFACYHGDVTEFPLHIQKILAEDSTYNHPHLHVAVSDTGDGLKKEDLERIFNPFEQADNSETREFAGTGLGLSLSRRLLELHGGTIWAESDGLGKGSTFHLVLPT